MTLDEYSVERGLNEPMTWERLIVSHRNLVDELNRGQRKEWREAMNAAVESAKSTTLDSIWIKKDDIRQMTVQQIIDMLGES